MLIAVDQFEEMYTINDADSRRELIGALAEYTTSRRDLTFGVITVRADYYGVLAENPRAARALQNATVLVPALDPGQLRDVIVGPAAVKGITVSDDLVDLLIADLRPGLTAAVSAAPCRCCRTHCCRRGRARTSGRSPSPTTSRPDASAGPSSRPRNASTASSTTPRRWWPVANSSR